MGILIINSVIAHHSTCPSNSWLFLLQDRLDFGLSQFSKISMEMAEWRITLEAAVHRLVLSATLTEEHREHKRLELMRRAFNRRIDEPMTVSEAEMHGRNVMRRTTA